MKALTDATSAYPVSNAGRAFISTNVPQVLVLPWASGLTGPEPCQQLVSDTSLMAFKKHRKRNGGLGG